MRSLSSDQIGEVFTTLRDRLPQNGREVRLAVKLRTDYTGPIVRPSRVVPAPRPIVASEAAKKAESQRAVLRDILRGLHFSKFGTSPKLQVTRPTEAVTPPPPPPAPLLLADLRTPRQKALARLSRGPEGPDVCPTLARRILHVNQQMAVQFGPWPRRVQALAYEVIHV